MTDTKRYGCYDKVIGNRRYYMAVRGTKVSTTTQYLDEKDAHGWVREEESVTDYRTEERAWDAVVDMVKGGDWRHSDDWPRENVTAW